MSKILQNHCHSSDFVLIINYLEIFMYQVLKFYNKIMPNFCQINNQVSFSAPNPHHVIFGYFTPFSSRAQQWQAQERQQTCNEWLKEYQSHFALSLVSEKTHLVLPAAQSMWLRGKSKVSLFNRCYSALINSGIQRECIWIGGGEKRQGGGKNT